MKAAHKRIPSPRWIAGGLALCLLALSLWALGAGAFPTSAGSVLTILGHSLGLTDAAAPALDTHVVLQLRLPRLLLATIVGASLSVCGALMQGMFRNPLADPGLLGVSGGAALGAAIAMAVTTTAALGLRVVGPPLAAFLGGCVAAVVVMRIGSRTASGDSSSLLLTGIALQALMGSATGLVVFLADDAALRGLSFWFLGGLGGATWSQLGFALPILLLSVVLALRLAPALDALLLGEAEASHLGLGVPALKRRIVLLTTILAATSVAVSGMIGFVGLVVPHIVRLLLGPGHRRLLPLSALLGAVLLLVADTAARTVADNREIPVGILTTACGAPFFLWLVVRSRLVGRTL